MHTFRIKPALCLFLSAALVASLMTAVFSVNSGVLSAQTSSGNLNNNGGTPNGGLLDNSNWDTDNLDFGGGSITARSFGVPIFAYSGGHDACVAGAPGFFQAYDTDGPGRVNDFPVAGDYTLAHTNRDVANPCAVFAQEQDRLVDTIEGGKLYFAKLSEDREWVVAEAMDAPGWFQNREAALAYGLWQEKGDDFYKVDVDCKTRVPVSHPYAARIDYNTSALGTDQPFLAVYDSASQTEKTKQVGLPFSIAIFGNLVDSDSNLCALAHDFSSGFLTSSDASLCASGLHPRGEDSSVVLAPGSGRTLSSLNTGGRLGMANRFWCRSDVRYERTFQGTARSDTPLVFGAPVGGSQSVTPQMGEFTGWGRMNCYHTALGVDPDAVLVGGIPGDTAPSCVYVFPLPECAEGLSGAELDAWKNKPVLDMVAEGCGEPEEEDEDGEVEDGEDDGGDVFEDPPAERPEFGDEPCRSFGFSVRENIPAEDNVFPGLAMRYDTDLAGHELASVAPHALTASPPRRVGDSAGCADGVEIRSTHSDADRKNANTTPTGSAFGDATAPPGADSPRYAAARVNFAHRVASWVAEHDCSVLQAEAGYLRQFALFQLEAAIAQVEGLKTEADRVAGLWGGYDADVEGMPGNGFLKDLGDLNRGRYEAYAAEKARLARDVSTTAGMAVTDLQTAETNLPAVPVPTPEGTGCKQDWDTHIKAVKDHITTALDTTALDTTALDTPALDTPVRDIPTKMMAYQTEVSPTLVEETRDNNDPGVASGSINAGLLVGTSENRDVNERVWYCNGEDGVVLNRATLRCELEDGSDYQALNRFEFDREVKDCSWEQTGSYSYVETVSYPDGNPAPKTSRTITVGVSRSANKPVETYQSCGDPDWNAWVEVEMGRTSGVWSNGVPGSSGGRAGLPSMVDLRFDGFKFDVLDADRRESDRETILGAYYPVSDVRSELASSVADDRDRATLRAAAGVNNTGEFIPMFAETTGPDADTTLRNLIMDYQRQYQEAYDNAVAGVLADLGGENIGVWSGLGWSYDADSLKWDRYTVEEDGWCDGSASRDLGDTDGLLNVPLSGEVGVWAQRLDFETGQVNGVVLPPNDDPPPSRQVECKIIRERTPKVDLEYEPVWNGSRWSAVRNGLDNTGLGALSFGQVDLKLEYELFQLNIGLEDTAPILCHTSYRTKLGNTAFNVASSAGSGVDVLAAASAHSSVSWSDPKNISTYDTDDTQMSIGRHCGESPPAGMENGWTWFDDTAHSDMAHVWTVRQVPPAADELELLPIAEAEAVHSSDFTSRNNFYGTVWNITTPTNGWSGVDNRHINLGANFEYALLASDKPITEVDNGNFTGWAQEGLDDRIWLGWPGQAQAQMPGGANVSWHRIRIGFLDCLPDVEDAAFIHTITAFEEGNNPRQGFAWDAIDYSLANPGNHAEFANLEVDAWYNPPLNIFEGNKLLRVLSGAVSTTADDGHRPDAGLACQAEGYRTLNTGNVIKWYLRTEPNRPQDIGQYVTVIRYTADDIARSSIDAGCGTPVIPVPDPANPGRYQPSKLGTPD